MNALIIAQIIANYKLWVQKIIIFSKISLNCVRLSIIREAKIVKVFNGKC